MTITTLSPKYQVVIPKKVRQKLPINVGMKFEVIALGNRIELVPLRPIKTLRGSLKGINTTIKRSKDRI
jgi:AbrB family looped-hinge helix DNA binding protein